MLVDSPNLISSANTFSPHSIINAFTFPTNSNPVLLPTQSMHLTVLLEVAV